MALPESASEPAAGAAVLTEPRLDHRAGNVRSFPMPETGREERVSRAANGPDTAGGIGHGSVFEGIRSSPSRARTEIPALRFPMSNETAGLHPASGNQRDRTAIARVFA